MLVDEEVTVPITIQVPSLNVNAVLDTVTRVCQIRWSYRGGYSKPALSSYIQEHGSTSASHNCGAAITGMNAEVWIGDKGVGVFSSTHQTQQNSSGQNNVHVSAYQQVPLYTFPTDYHAFGSQIQWRFRATMSYGPGSSGPSSLCSGGTAFYPGSPSKTPC